MLSIAILVLLYFLPAVLGRNKADSTAIFLVNLFLGWTVIGWVVAFLWACASDRPVYLQNFAAAGGGRFCSRCGTPAVSVVQYCSSCGARW